MDKIDELKKIKELFDIGAISKTEFEDLKEKVINEKKENFSKNIKFVDVNPNTSNHSKKEKANIAVILFAIFSLICVFLPWSEVTSEISVSGYSNSWSSGSVYGISIPQGIFAFIMSFIGCVIAFTGKKWAGIFGLINCIDGISYVFGWLNFNEYATFKSSLGSIDAGIEPQFGLILFIIFSFLFMICSFFSSSK